jgi:GNAT superfamily N-acetyltransferase
MATIAPATVDDIPHLAALLDELFAQEADFTPDRMKQERGLRLILASPHVGVIFTARAGDEVVGMVSLLFTTSTAEGGPVCWLEDMVVRHDQRGSGLGSQLLSHATEYARVQGYSRITLLTDRANSNARRFYARHGFEESEMTTLRLHLS